MNKEHFLTELKIHLKPLTSNQSSYILKMYNEIFDERIQKGELEQAISKDLGNPKEIAQAILKEFNISVSPSTSHKEDGWEEFTENPYLHSHSYSNDFYQEPKKSSALKKILRLISITLLNILFMFWVVLVIFLLLLSGWLVCGLFLVSPILGVISAFSCANALGFLQLFISILLCGIALLISLVLFPLSKLFFKLLLSYIKWNLNWFKGRGN